MLGTEGSITVRRKIIRCLFRAQGTSSKLPLLEFLSAPERSGLPKDLFEEAAECYWGADILLSRLDRQELTQEQFCRLRWQVISKLEAQPAYSRRLLEVEEAGLPDPLPTRPLNPPHCSCPERQVGGDC